MRSRKKQILFSVVVVLFVTAFLFAARENDPVYQGKRLSEHLKVFEWSSIGGGGSSSFGLEGPRGMDIVLAAQDQKAFDAVDAVGTNALPMLARMLAAKDTPVGKWLQSQRLKHNLLKRLIPISLVSGYAYQMDALAAFHRLGPRAASIAPEIVPLLDDSGCIMSAILALKYIRPEREQDILSLTNVLHLQTTPMSPGWYQMEALLTLSTFGAKASGAVPVLIESLTSTNEYVQAASAVALARIGGPPEKVVPLIIANLPKTNPPRPSPGAGSVETSAFMRYISTNAMHHRNVTMSLWAIGEYGRHASNALAVLSRLEQHPGVSQAARNAAARIKADANAASP